VKVINREIRKRGGVEESEMINQTVCHSRKVLTLPDIDQSRKRNKAVRHVWCLFERGGLSNNHVSSLEAYLITEYRASVIKRGLREAGGVIM
jgi:hypothetical protein